jgi:hypothetical protein
MRQAPRSGPKEYGKPRSGTKVRAQGVRETGDEAVTKVRAQGVREPGDEAGTKVRAKGMGKPGNEAAMG